MYQWLWNWAQTPLCPTAQCLPFLTLRSHSSHSQSPWISAHLDETIPVERGWKIISRLKTKFMKIIHITNSYWWTQQYSKLLKQWQKTRSFVQVQIHKSENNTYVSYNRHIKKICIKTTQKAYRHINPKSFTLHGLLYSSFL